MAQTMEQRRAADAWKCSQGRSKDYVNLAKGLPALIMNSGLLQVMAFLHEKGSKTSQRHCNDLAGQLRAWLRGQFPKQITSAEFAPFMEALMKSEPRTYQLVTAEAFAWLRWVRQMAPAALAEEG